jgi:hypothetical protein
MLITLDIFSGRRNPSWLLSDKKAKELRDRVAQRALVADADDGGSQGGLGFRGMVVAGLDDSDAGLPANFRIGGMGGTPDAGALDAGRSALSLDEAEDTVRWLLATGAHALDDLLGAAVFDEVDAALRSQRDSEPAAAADEVHEQTLSDASGDAACILANTPYNPGFWNVPAVQPKNNCYNYAMNHRSDTFAQPGRISGHPNNVMQCPNVATAANWDGCKAFCSGSNKNVALVVWPGVDYHWYRRHSNGFWGHKPGQTAARNTDNAGQIINGTTRTPANCNRGPYTHFCGYRFSPTGMKVR